MALSFLRWPLPALYSSKSHLPGKGRVVVAGADEPFEAELVDVSGEVLEEVAPKRVVAVAVDGLLAEGVVIVFEVGFDFLLDFDVLGVELVLLGGLGGAQASIQCPWRLWRCWAALGLWSGHRADSTANFVPAKVRCPLY